MGYTILDAAKDISKRRVAGEDAGSAVQSNQPSLAKTKVVDTGKVTASNPDTIKKLSPADSAKSLANARAKAAARAKAMKLAKERQVQ